MSSGRRTRRFPLGRLSVLAAGSVAALALSTAARAGLADIGDVSNNAYRPVSPLYLLQDSRPADAGPGAATLPAAPGQPAELVVRVTEVAGVVSASTDGKTWKRVAVGDTYGAGASFRTGMRSAVTCRVGSDQMFTLESLSTMRVEEAVRTGGKEKTDLTMKYGSASYGIEAAGREYDSVIRTPGSTMAIRGTVVRVVDRPGFAPQAESYTGRALFRTAKGVTFVGGGGGYSVASAVQGSAADTALAKTTVDPSIASARTAGENAVVSQQLSQGGVLGFDQRANIPVVRNGSPLPDAALPGALPGRLSFALRWTGNADLNFIVDNQAGPDSTKIILGGFKPTEILFPGYGLNVSTSGGLIPFDNRGGPRGGTEIAYWKGSFPTGVYGVGVLHASGGDASFKINAFLDGQPLPIFTFDAEGNVTRVNTLKGEIGRGGGDGAILFVPRNDLFESIATPGDDQTDPVGDAAARAIAAVKSQATGPKAVATTKAPLSLNPNLKATKMGPSLPAANDAKPAKGR
ncbi:MAG TPA: hypothetical protein VF796_12375 [Humisphaera sp.]